MVIFFFLISFAYIISFIYFCININSNSTMETPAITIRHYYTGKILFVHTCEQADAVSGIAIYPSDIMAGEVRLDFTHVVWFNQ